MHFSPNQIITKNHLPEDIDFVNGVILLIDKPQGWTSFDVVNKIRFKIRHGLKIKKIKVGHAGTLDPMATGLLLVCTGKLTKQIDLLQAEIKSYSGTMKIGATTSTYDAESQQDAVYRTDHINQEMISAKKVALTGAQMQVPPIYSAIKISGKAAYELARKGQEVVMKSRPVTIYDFDIYNSDLDNLSFFVKCSKGTYIRSLVFDFGKMLASGAYLTSLRREAIGDFQVIDALNMDQISQYIERVTLYGIITVE
jgi:tRNA pseudouridine55 synthase